MPDEVRDLFAERAAEGAAAQASYGHLPQSTQLTEEQVRGAIEGGNFDGVVVARVDGLDRDGVRDLAVAVRDKGARAVVVIGAPEGGGVAAVAAVAGLLRPARLNSTGAR